MERGKGKRGEREGGRGKGKKVKGKNGRKGPTGGRKKERDGWINEER